MYKLFAILLLVTIVGCSSTPGKKKKKEKTKYVVIETPYGNMKVKLYNQTPLHRDNFIKLVNEGFYDSLLFHRVINHFMIQGGDPDSKGAAPGVLLGNGGPGYDIDAEFVPELFHKKGAVAAAREGDNVNPQKKSSGSQFYIVQGKVFSLDDLAKMEERINLPRKQKFFEKFINNPDNADFKSRLDSLNKVKDYKTLNTEVEAVVKNLEKEMDEQVLLFHYSEEQKKAYSIIGGTPHLDQNYTVFGEVVEGLNIIDSIAAVKTDKNNRPVVDVMMKMKVVRK
jgi:cyclophilin family peptidyl-prolyl cis-trans isomerase